MAKYEQVDRTAMKWLDTTRTEYTVILLKLCKMKTLHLCGIFHGPQCIVVCKYRTGRKACIMVLGRDGAGISKVVRPNRAQRREE